MSEGVSRVGTIGWVDLTVGDAATVRDFYKSVVGWEHDACPMGGYDDYVMQAAGGTAVAGVCHARGANAGVPACWLMYIVVADLNASVGRAVERGGAVMHGPRRMGSMGAMCIIRDPAGAVCALFQED